MSANNPLISIFPDAILTPRAKFGSHNAEGDPSGNDVPLTGKFGDPREDTLRSFLAWNLLYGVRQASAPSSPDPYEIWLKPATATGTSPPTAVVPPWAAIWDPVLNAWEPLTPAYFYQHLLWYAGCGCYIFTRQNTAPVHPINGEIWENSSGGTLSGITSGGVGIWDSGAWVQLSAGGGGSGLSAIGEYDEMINLTGGSAIPTGVNAVSLPNNYPAPLANLVRNYDSATGEQFNMTIAQYQSLLGGGFVGASVGHIENPSVSTVTVALPFLVPTGPCLMWGWGPVYLRTSGGTVLAGQGGLGSEGSDLWWWWNDNTPAVNFRVSNFYLASVNDSNGFNFVQSQINSLSAPGLTASTAFGVGSTTPGIAAGTALQIAAGGSSILGTLEHLFGCFMIKQP